MQMIFNPGGTSPNKSDSIDTEPASSSPWANLLSMGLKILTAVLGGGAQVDGIDKVDSSSPMQVPCRIKLNAHIDTWSSSNLYKFDTLF